MTTELFAEQTEAPTAPAAAPLSQASPLPADESPAVSPSPATAAAPGDDWADNPPEAEIETALGSVEAAAGKAIADSTPPEPPAELRSWDETLEAHPSLQKAVETDAQLGSALAQAFTRSAQLTDFQQLFPTAEEARLVADQARTLGSFDRLYYSDKAQAPQQLLEQLHESQYLRDPESGEFAHDERGQRISTGAYDRMVGAYRDLLFDALEQQAARQTDAQLSDAVRILRDRLRPGGHASVEQGKQPAPSPVRDAADADFRERWQRLESLEQRERELQRTQAREQLEAVAGTVREAVRADIQQYLSAAALPTYIKSKVVDDVFAQLNEQAGTDASFQSRMDALLRLATAPGWNGSREAKQRVIAAARGHAHARMGTVTQAILREATRDLQQQQQARDAKTAEQRRRVEVKSGGGAPPPARRSDGERLRQAEQRLGRRLSDREILDL